MLADYPSTSHPTTPNGSRPWLVRCAILLAILMTLVPVVLIGWRWMNVQFPNAALFIRGDESSAGTEVAVTNEQGLQIFRDRMTEANEYQLVVLVEQGLYNVLARKDGKIIVQDRLYVPNGGGVLLQVKPPATEPPIGQASPPPGRASTSRAPTLEPSQD